MNMNEQKLIPKDKMDIDIVPKPPKYIDVDYMTLPNIDNNPLFYDEDAQEILDYWTDGKMVY